MKNEAGVGGRKKSRLADLFDKIKSVVYNLYLDLTTHWKKPAQGNYVPYKEIAAYSIGGFGKEFVLAFVAFFALSASNTLLGSTIGLQPVHMQYLVMIQQGLGVLFSVFRAQLVDNTRSKWGRFRPYILTAGFPVVILGVIFVFLPFETMTYNTKLALAFIFSTLCSGSVGAIALLYFDTYNELRTVISPNSYERGKVIAISSIAYSLAPTIFYALTPILSEKTGGYTDIATYRWVMAPFAVIGVLFGVFAALGTKERLIVPKSYTPKINLWLGIKNIYGNKYFLVRTISSIFVFLRTANAVILNWLYIYDLQDMALMSGLTLFMGTASGIAMFLSPFLLKKLGTRNIYLTKELFPIICSVFVVLSLKSFPLFFIFIYLNTFVSAFSLIVDPVVHGEVKDYQQYITGKRLDFTFGTAGALLLPISLLTGLLIPFIYEGLGITKNYDVLYDPQIRYNILYTVSLLSVLGSVLCFIPLIFYNLTTSKYENIVKVLKVRAMFENHAENNLSPDDVKQGVELIREAQATCGLFAEPLSEIKARFKEAKKSDLKAALKNYREEKKRSEIIESAQILVNELNKYESPMFLADGEIAEKIVALGLNPRDADEKDYFLSAALALPAATPEEKKYRKRRLSEAKAILKMYAKLEKLFDGNAVEPDYSEFDRANAMPSSTPEERKEKKLKLKSLQKEFGAFDKAATPFVNARKFLLLRKSYAAYSEIEAGYGAAVEAIEASRLAEAEKEARLAEAHKEELERAKAAKAARKAEKRGRNK